MGLERYDDDYYDEIYYADTEEDDEFYPYCETINNGLSVPDEGLNDKQIQYLTQLSEKCKEHKLLFLHNFWCCQTCGFSYLTSNLSELEESYHGVVFYHNQDFQTLIEYDELYVAYDSFEKELSQTFIGKQFCDILTELDIPHVWDGSPTKRIKIKF